MQRVRLILGKTAKTFSKCFCFGKGRGYLEEDLPYLRAFLPASQKDTGGDNVLLCDADNFRNSQLPCEPTSNIQLESEEAGTGTGTISDTQHNTNTNTNTNNTRTKHKPNTIARSNSVCPIEVDEKDSNEASIVKQACAPDINDDDYIIGSEHPQHNDNDDEGKDTPKTGTDTEQKLATKIQPTEGACTGSNDGFQLENLLPKIEDSEPVNIQYSIQELKSKYRPVTESVSTTTTRIRYSLKELKVLDTSTPLVSRQTAPAPRQKGNGQRFIVRQQHQTKQYRNPANLSQFATNKPVINIKLSLNEEVKLSECKNAWRPKSLTNDCNNQNIEDVLKKVRGILNKLTSENFDVLLKQMTGITVNTAEQMQSIMLLVFEKTISEPNFAPIYAKFFKLLHEGIQTEFKEVFNRLLIEKLKEEFALNVNNADAKELKLQEITTKLNDATKPEDKTNLQAELELQEYLFRRRAWGTVHFIGEMFKLHSISADHVIFCIESLLAHKTEEKLEYMCKVLKTVGWLLETNDVKSFNTRRINNIFANIETITKEAKEPGIEKIKICTRVRFLMEDLIDLRSQNWGQPQSSVEKSPDQHEEQCDQRNTHTKSEKLNVSHGKNFTARKNTVQQRFTSGGEYYIQNSTHASLKWQHQQIMNKYQQNMNYNKKNYSCGDSYLQNFRTRSASKSNQRQYFTVEDHTKEMLKSYFSKDIKQLLNHLMEEYLDCLPSRSSRWQKEVLTSWKNSKYQHRICLIYYILTNYLHLAGVRLLERNACANIFIYLMKYNALDKLTLMQAYEQFAEAFPDMLMDVPNGWTYVFEFLGPLLHEGLISVRDIWRQNWRSNIRFTERFLNAFVVYFTKNFGPNYMRNMWHEKFKLGRGRLFINDQYQWRQFVTDNQLQFLYDRNAKPKFASQY